MGRVRLGKRRGLVGGQRVDAAAAVDLVAGHVGVVPRALAHGHGARDDAGRYLHDDLHGAAVVEHLHGVAVGQVAFGGVQRVHPQLAGVRLLQHLDVAVGGMAAALEVEAGQLQRVFLRQRVGVALGLGAVHRQRADELIVVQLPVGHLLFQGLRVNLDLAGGRVQRIGLGVVAEVLEGHVLAFRALLAVDALLQHGLEGRLVGVALATLLVKALEPTHLIESLGELVALAQALGDVGQGGVQRATLELRRGDGGAGDGVGHIARVLALHDVGLLHRHEVGQQDVGVLRGIGKEGVPHHDELAFGLVGQDVVGAVDVVVLVGQAVAAVVEDELHGHRQGVATAHAVAGGGHSRAAVHRVDPGEHADGGFHAVVGHGDAIVGRHVVAVQVGPGVAAVDADVAGENGQHADGAGRLLAVAAPLRALALVDGAGLRRGDLAGQRLDGGGGHERDGARPLRGLRGFVRAFAGDVVHVGLALAAQFLGHGGVVVADAVLREEVVVDQVLGDHDIGAGVHERRIGTGTHGDPLVGMNGRRVGVARVDDDDLRAGLLQAHHVVVGRAAAGHLRLAAVVAEQHDELGVGHYRSGHNEAVLKTVCPKGRVGSNPTLCAKRTTLNV